MSYVVSWSSIFRQVLFNDSTEREDLSAVQTDKHSTFVAAETSFVGFNGQVWHPGKWIP